jgi:hypothetical protein
MTLTLVNSTSIRAVGYDGNRLYVQFHTSSTTYTHYNVPYSVYCGLMGATSHGAYYNRCIRGRYR